MQVSQHKRVQLFYALERWLGFYVYYSDESKERLRLDSSDLESVLVEAFHYSADNSLLPHLLASWLEVHARQVRTGKLLKLTRLYHKKYGGNFFWLAVLSKYLESEKGLTKWKTVYEAVLKEGMWEQPEYQRETAELRGDMPWLEGTPLKLSRKGLRVRESDVRTVESLAEKNRQYALRLAMGATVRADAAYAMEMGLSSTQAVADFARCSHSSAKEALTALRASGLHDASRQPKKSLRRA